MLFCCLSFVLFEYIDNLTLDFIFYCDILPFPFPRRLGLDIARISGRPLPPKLLLSAEAAVDGAADDGADEALTAHRAPSRNLFEIALTHGAPESLLLSLLESHGELVRPPRDAGVGAAGAAVADTVGGADHLGCPVHALAAGVRLFKTAALERKMPLLAMALLEEVVTPRVNAVLLQYEVLDSRYRLYKAHVEATYLGADCTATATPATSADATATAGDSAGDKSGDSAPAAPPAAAAPAAVVGAVGLVSALSPDAVTAVLTARVNGGAAYDLPQAPGRSSVLTALYAPVIAAAIDADSPALLSHVQRCLGRSSIAAPLPDAADPVPAALLVALARVNTAADTTSATSSSAASASGGVSAAGAAATEADGAPGSAAAASEQHGAAVAAVARTVKTMGDLWQQLPALAYHGERHAVPRASSVRARRALWHVLRAVAEQAKADFLAQERSARNTRSSRTTAADFRDKDRRDRGSDCGRDAASLVSRAFVAGSLVTQFAAAAATPVSAGGMLAALDPSTAAAAGARTGSSARDELAREVTLAELRRGTGALGAALDQHAPTVARNITALAATRYQDRLGATVAAIATATVGDADADADADALEGSASADDAIPASKPQQARLRFTPFSTPYVGGEWVSLAQRSGSGMRVSTGGMRTEAGVTVNHLYENALREAVLRGFAERLSAHVAAGERTSSNADEDDADSGDEVSDHDAATPATFVDAHSAAETALGPNADAPVDGNGAAGVPAVRSRDQEVMQMWNSFSFLDNNGNANASDAVSQKGDKVKKGCAKTGGSEDSAVLAAAFAADAAVRTRSLANTARRLDAGDLSAHAGLGDYFIFPNKNAAFVTREEQQRARVTLFALQMNAAVTAARRKAEVEADEAAAKAEAEREGGIKEAVTRESETAGKHAHAHADTAGAGVAPASPASSASLLQSRPLLRMPLPTLTQELLDEQEQHQLRVAAQYVSVAGADVPPDAAAAGAGSQAQPHVGSSVVARAIPEELARRLNIVSFPLRTPPTSALRPNAHTITITESGDTFAHGHGHGQLAHSASARGIAGARSSRLRMNAGAGLGADEGEGAQSSQGSWFSPPRRGDSAIASMLNYHRLEATHKRVLRTAISNVIRLAGRAQTQLQARAPAQRLDQLPHQQQQQQHLLEGKSGPAGGNSLAIAGASGPGVSKRPSSDDNHGHSSMPFSMTQLRRISRSTGVPLSALAEPWGDADAPADAAGDAAAVDGLERIQAQNPEVVQRFYAEVTKMMPPATASSAPSVMSDLVDMSESAMAAASDVINLVRRTRIASHHITLVLLKRISSH